MKRSFKRIKYLFLIVLTTFSLVAFGQATKVENSTDVPENWKTINTVEYFIEYPDSFKLNMTGQMGTCFIIFSKPVSPNDLFKENVSLMIQNLNNQNLNLDKFVEITEKQLKTFMSNGKLIESKREKSNNSEFQKFVFSGTQGPFHLKFEQYDWIKNDKAYILTLSCETSQFDKYKKVGEEIMNSFKIK